MTVRITEFLPPVDLPSDDELDHLLAMVTAKYPQLAGFDPASHRRQFAAAINFLCYVYRPDKINSLYAASYWVDLCREWLNTRGIHPNEMTLTPFVAAVVASGIKHEPLDQFPFALNFAISLGSGTSNAWREVLRTGIPEPVAPRRPRPRGVEQRLDVVPRW